MTELETEMELLTSCYPNGESWIAKNIEESNLRKFITIFALENLKTKQQVDNISKELDIWSATEYSITDWEKLVGLPDTIFTSISLNLQDRINLVALKLFGLKIIRKTDLINILERLFPSLIGSGWYIKTGIENSTFPFTFPFVFNENEEIAMNNFYVYIPMSLITENSTFPFTFPFVFANTLIEQIENVVNYIVPFTKNVIVNTY